MSNKHDEIVKARVIASRNDEMDVMKVQLEAPAENAEYTASVGDILKMKDAVEVVAPGSLPRDGLVIEDQRRYD